MTTRGIVAGGNAADSIFLQSGTGAVSRSVQSKERDIVSAADFASLQAAVDSGNKAIYLPAGSYTPAVITTDGVNLYGAGLGNTYIITTSTTGHGVKFYPNDTTTTTKFLNNCGIFDLTIYSAANKTAGAGVYALQCSGFRLSNVQIQNHPEGLLVQGGQLSVYDKPTVYASSSVLTSGVVANSQAIRLCTAPIDGGNIQHCYTNTVIAPYVAAGRVLDKGLRIEDCDGSSWVGGYISGAATDDVYIAGTVANSYNAVLKFTGVYIDGVSAVTAPAGRNGVNIPAAANGVNYDITFDNCFIGNYTGKGMVVGKDVRQLTLIGGTKFANTDNWGVDFVGANTTSEVKIEGCSINDCGDITVSTGGVRLSTFLNAIVIGNTFTGMANTGASALTLTGTNANGVFDNNVFSGNTTDITNTATFTGKVSGITQAWTPAVTFATPGNLSLSAYTTQIGRSSRKGNLCTDNFSIQVVPTHTTASGDLQITGSPVTSSATTFVYNGSLTINGITKAGYTNFNVRKDSSNALFTFMASGSGVAQSKVAAADVPSGGTLILNATITYEAA